MSDSLERAAAVSLFVGDLSIFCTEDQIREFFSPFGKIDDVKIIRCETTQKNLCYGFVKFSAQESAAAAMKERNKTLLCGRPIRCGEYFCNQTPYHMC